MLIEAAEQDWASESVGDTEKKGKWKETVNVRISENTRYRKWKMRREQ